MKGDAAKAQPGDVVLSRDGTVAVLRERKKPEESHLPGWWVIGPGGLADYALEGPSWLLLDKTVAQRLWELMEAKEAAEDNA